MARQIFSLLLIVALLVASSTAQSCLGTPPVSGLLSSGTACDGSIPCAKGLACDLTSTCSEVKVGDTCVSDGGTGCPAQSSCVGNYGSQKCVANANPGGSCAQNAKDGAVCSTTNGCSTPTAGKCLGSLGDGCSAGTDCQSTICASGVCKSKGAFAWFFLLFVCFPPLADRSPFSPHLVAPCGSGSCNFNQFCDTTSTCTALPTTGDCNVFGNCAPGVRCVNTDLTATKTHCVKDYSVANGGFCTSGIECSTGLCWRNKCQAKSPDFCSWPSSASSTGCALGEVCSCSNGYLTNGYGTCTSDKCWTSFSDLRTCLTQNCENFSFDAPNFCVFKSCNTQYQAYDSCDSGHALWTLLVLF